MFKFLFVMFFFFILLLFLMGFSVLRSFKRFLFGDGEKHSRNSKQQHQQNHRSSSQSNNSYTRTNRKKIFTEEDGEYVDYEEVK